MDLNNLSNYATKSRTEIVLVLDESGSMQSYCQEAIDGLNNFIERQKAVNGQADVTVVTFNSPSNIKLTHDAVPVSQFPVFNHSNYQPQSNTALYDAIGKSIIATNTRLAALPASEQPNKVIFCIFTDGEENSSLDFDQMEIRQMITEQEDKYHWDFLYLGANQNAYDYGKQFGIKAGKALSYKQSTDGIAAAFAASSDSVARYRSSGRPSGDQFFTEEDHATQQSLGAASTPLRNG